MAATPDRLYRLMHRLPRPSSYVGRLLLIAFLGTHLPLLGLLAYVVVAKHAWPEILPLLSVAALMTLIGAVLTLWGTHAMLAPLRLTARALRRYTHDGTRPSLPTHYTDEAGRLMTDTQHALTHLDQLLTFRNRMIGVVSHDVRTPASSIRMACDVLTREMDSEAPRPSVTGKMLDIISTSVRHQLELVDALLALARHEEAELALNPSTGTAKRLMQEVVGQTRLLAARKQIQLQYTAELPAPLTLHTDLGKLRQVLHNLVTNAIKYTPAGGAVTLRLTAASGAVCFEVADTGTGIDADAKQTLFEPFSTHRPGTNHENGTGLGLWICRTFTDLLGGTIDVESAPGAGTTFRLHFPRAVLTQAASPERTRTG